MSDAVARSVSLRLGSLIAGLVLAAIYIVESGRRAGAVSLTIVLLALVGVSFVACGVFLWQRRPAQRLGVVMTAVGLLWLVGESLRLVDHPLLWTAGVWVSDVWNVPFAYFLLSFPSGRLATSADRWILGVFVLATVPLQAVWFLFWVPDGGPGNVLALWPNPGIADPIDTVQRVLIISAALVLSVHLVRRWIRSSPPMRRASLPILAGAAVQPIAGALSIMVKLRLDIPIQALLIALLLAYIAIPIAVLVVMARARIARAAVADLVVELGQTPTPARLRDALANALGDPTLRVVTWSPAQAAFVEQDAQPATLPAEGSGQAVTRLERAGVPLAAIVHDAALLDDPGLVASVASAMRLAVENERLQAEVEAQLDEVRASRSRIVEAGDAERRRVERDLHDGAQQRLVSMTLALRLARARLGDDADPALAESLAQAAEEARGALAELRELARGIHPQILTEAGLTAAVGSLADRAPVDVTVVSTIDGRLPPAVERTAYFVVSEALANVSKHAGTATARVDLDWADGSVSVVISDDGPGGVDAAAGSGLRGLVDRLAAIDGTLDLESPPGGGTRVRARIPSAGPEVAASAEIAPAMPG